jgi:hypothetical protein
MIPGEGKYDGLFVLRDHTLLIPNGTNIEILALDSKRICPGNGALELKNDGKTYIIMKKYPA